MKILKGLVIFLLSLSLFAGVVPQEKLDNVNAYIKVLLTEYADFLDISITKAETNDKNGKLEKINTVFDLKEYGVINLGLELVKTEVKLDAGYSFLDTDGELSNPEEVKEMIKEANEYADVINKKGFYKITIKTETTEVGTKLAMLMLPISEEAISINKLNMHIFIPTNYKTEKFVFSFHGSFNAKSDLINTAQDGLTGIFTDLANQKEPKDSDFDKLMEVFEAILDALEETEEE